MKPRTQLLIAIALLIAADSTHASENTKYEAAATVVRTDEKRFRCVVTIISDASTDREKVLASPHVLMHNGLTASVQVGSEEKDVNDPKIAVFSGVHVQILHAVGDDNVVVVTRIVENNRNVWVDVKRVAITNKKPAG